MVDKSSKDPLAGSGLFGGPPGSTAFPPVGRADAPQQPKLQQRLPSPSPSIDTLPPITEQRKMTQHVRKMVEEANAELERFLSVVAESEAAADSVAVRAAQRRVPLEEWPQYKLLRSLLENEAKEEEERATQKDTIAVGEKKAQEAHQERVEEAADSDGDDEGGLFRKTRMTELEKRLENIRMDPAKRAELRDKIAKYKEAKRNATQCKRHFVAENRSLAPTLTADKKLQDLRDASDKLSERIIRTSEAKKARNILQPCARCRSPERYFAASSATISIQQARQLRRLDPAQNWAALLGVAARVKAFFDAMKLERAKRAEDEKCKEAAATVQRWYKLQKAKAEGRRYRARMKIVQKILTNYARKWKLERKNKATNILRQFLSDVQDVNQVTMVVRRFRLAVSQAQILVRKYDEVKHAQERFMLMQWVKAEDQASKGTWERPGAQKPKVELVPIAPPPSQTLAPGPRPNTGAKGSGSVAAMVAGGGRAKGNRMKTPPATKPTEGSSPLMQAPSQPPPSTAAPISLGVGSAHSSALALIGPRTNRPSFIRLNPLPLEEVVKKVPEAIKLKLIGEALAQKRGAYALEYRQYRSQIQRIAALQQAGQTPPEEVQAALDKLHRPTIRLLLTHEELVTLMEKGVASWHAEKLAKASARKESTNTDSKAVVVDSDSDEDDDDLDL